MRNERFTPGTIIVGVDGSEHAERALRWAVRQAGLEGRQLTLIHAAGVGDLRSVAWASGAAEALPDLLDTAQEVIGTAVALAESMHPDVDVVGVPMLGDPRQVLVDLSEDAHLVVVGSRGRGTFSSMLLGSVSVSVARHSHCPVVVTRPGQDAVVEDGVLVGADGTAESVPVIEFAFRQASLRGVPLTVMHTSFDVTVALASIPDVSSSPDEADDFRLLLSESVAGLSEKFPDVSVSLELGSGLVDECLTRGSSCRDLVVVGRHRVDTIAKLLTGSISAAVLERCDSPVAVVPEGDPTYTS
jgi:nucleotide-binding universal stress UspA family protein